MSGSSPYIFLIFLFTYIYIFLQKVKLVSNYFIKMYFILSSQDRDVVAAKKGITYVKIQKQEFHKNIMVAWQG